MINFVVIQIINQKYLGWDERTPPNKNNNNNNNIV